MSKKKRTTKKRPSKNITKTKASLNPSRSTHKRFYNQKIRPLLSRDIAIDSPVVRSISRKLSKRVHRKLDTKFSNRNISNISNSTYGDNYHRNAFLSAFKEKQMLICKSRKLRREVLFSRKKVGGGNRPPNWKLTSYVKCKRS